MSVDGATRRVEPAVVKHLVCFALKEEAGAFQKLAVGESNVSILITGVGRRNAELAINAGLKACAPRLVLTCGFAGALNPVLAAGDVIFSTNDTGLHGQLVKAGAKTATFFCATTIAISATEKQELRRTTGADAVEMESEAIQHICRERGIPCATVRAISDIAGEDLPLDFNGLSHEDLSLSYGKLALAVAKSPGKIPALLRLQRNCTGAAKQLAAVLRKIIDANLPTLER